jgi:2-polyprenyl-3-methyl-5-hydroxy-6-metoxy-1,4-benzoquinol methylase
LRQSTSSTWTKAQVEQLLAEEEFLYQRVELPHGLATPGRDRMPTARRIYPQNLSGKSVLDVGSYLGFFCFEALRRGAERAVGFEADAESVRKARRLADCLGLHPEFIHGDVEYDALPGRFDYVICLNVLHHFRDPLAVLEKFARAVRHTLVLETVAFETRERAKTGLSLVQSKFLSRQPVLYAATTGPGGRYRTPRFVVSRPALDRILTLHRNTFSRVTHTRSDFRDRYITIAEKRRIRRLIVLAGPPGTDKTGLAQRLRTGKAPSVASALGLTAKCPVVDARGLQAIEEPELDTLVYDYNFLVPYEHHHGRYDRDEFLDIMETAEDVVIATVGAMPAGHDQSAGSTARFTDARSAGDVYRRWFAFSETRGKNYVVAPRESGEYDIVSPDAWRSRLPAA